MEGNKINIIDSIFNVVPLSTFGGIRLHNWIATANDQKSYDIVKKCISRTIDPNNPSENDKFINTKDGHGRTPLHLAVINGSFDFIKYLIELGADTSIEDNFGYTAYTYAVEKLRIQNQLCLFLFPNPKTRPRKKFKKNEIFDDGQTILHILATNDKIYNLDDYFLILETDNWAKPHLESYKLVYDKYGMTPYMYAMQYLKLHNEICVMVAPF